MVRGEEMPARVNLFPQPIPPSLPPRFQPDPFSLSSEMIPDDILAQPPHKFWRIIHSATMVTLIIFPSEAFGLPKDSQLFQETILTVCMMVLALLLFLLGYGLHVLSLVSGSFFLELLSYGFRGGGVFAAVPVISFLAPWEKVFTYYWHRIF